jgi:hypothetical protein
MKLKSFILLLASMLLMIGCQDGTLNNEETAAVTDEQLIEAIKTATNKQAISIEQLPSASQTVLEQDYSESSAELAQMAPELGYEVTMRRDRGTRVGERSEAYFDLKGRELRSRDKDRDGRDRKECFDFVYPVTFIMPDGSTITGNNEEELWLAVRNWYAANPGVRERPALQYPVDIIFRRDSTIVTINNDEEMRRAYALCDEDREPCFDFVYPITYIMPDGSTVTGNREELGLAIRSWYAANPGIREKPTLQYPVDIIFDDGTTLTVNNDEELRGAYALCDR